jgi:hypothetical protein
MRTAVAAIDRLSAILQQSNDCMMNDFAKLSIKLMDTPTTMETGSSKFAHFYKSPCLSDFDLYLMPETVSEPSGGSLPPLHLGPTPVHGLLLAAESAHFMVKIKGPFGVPVVEVGGRKRLFLKVVVLPRLQNAATTATVWHHEYLMLPLTCSTAPGSNKRCKAVALASTPHSHTITVADSHLASWLHRHRYGCSRS